MKSLTRRTFLGSAAAGPLLGYAAKSRPNVILLLTDDQGYGNLHCHGNPIIETPNLDRLHAESVRLTNFHVDPLCAPTRSALMTGRYSCRTGVWATVMGRSILRRDEITMGEVFSRNGYRTGIFGKWHLGDNYPYHPWNRGFHDALVCGGGGVTQTPDYWGNNYFDDTYFRNGKPEKVKGYCTDVWFDNALHFIEQNRERPFFLYLPTNAPHAPFRVEEKYSQRYRKRWLNPELAAFYGMITNIDVNAGRLLERLKQLHLDDNTLLIFMTDNGTAAPARQGTTFNAFNAGMRSTKASAYEGGHRVPCFVRWPDAGIRGGRDIASLACHFDLLPTLIDLLGLTRPEGHAFDGISLGPLLSGRGGMPERTLVVQTQQRDVPKKWDTSAVMTDRWRLVNGSELYDIHVDPGQHSDISGANADTVDRLRSAYERWWASVSTQFGEKNPVVIGNDSEEPSHITCHDWHTDAVQHVPWNQEVIRQAPVANGVWALEIERPGPYRFTLRQQPEVANFPIRGKNARLKVAEFDKSIPIKLGAIGVDFTVELQAGRTEMQTWIEDDDGQIRGAYFVDVRSSARETSRPG